MSSDSENTLNTTQNATKPPPFGLMDRDRVFDFLVEYPTRESIADTKHGNILYLEDISVSFDGFKALNELTQFICGDAIAGIDCLLGHGASII